ncbi:hypothetical protein CWE15_06605 [Aliidiomarina taiwanensis]|uniref:Response regulatory domain-containing protein n=1 Tax=Aliidiomarina taiwanensis TaxID=946228 RepID=A0A432X852_9GAMM|nr:response regulator [Aliidiomarina taiwanensis]RUO43064.1 hypothetical protein CWE15_06605 [Aliidiomarina taiwanensis]
MFANKVLVIEDDAVFSTVIDKFLSARGYQTLFATNGETGLALYHQEQPDVVLCDLELPQVSGLQVLQELVQAAATTPVIVISGSERLADVREALQLGASDYLVKPIQQLHVLDTAIRNCLTRNNYEFAWEQEQWELNDHIDVLFGNESMRDHLVEEFAPQENLRLPVCEVSHQIEPGMESQVLLVQQRFPNNQGFLFVAKSQALKEQDIIALLVLRSLLNPFLRQGYSSHAAVLRTPAQLLQLLNQELCNSRIRSAFDVAALWVNGNTGEVCWALSGEHIRFNVQTRPGLAIGIWAQAQYHEQQGQLGKAPITLNGAGVSIALTPLLADEQSPRPNKAAPGST